ncbi:MAG: hypothetical protein ACJASB_001568 [Shewanella psychromarinicola]|jgi:hypothetical protein
MFTIPLHKDNFKKEKTNVIKSNDFEINTFIYNSGVHAVEMKSSQGHLVILPFMGQMIWDAEFLGVDLCMKNAFNEPKVANQIVNTYGCYSFHAGLLRMGCPTPQDDHVLHGEFPCASMDYAWLMVDENSITLAGSYEYIMGFGDHYIATPTVVLQKDVGIFDITMTVKNLATTTMPLQYMCHTNAAFFEGAVMTQNIPDSAIKLRESVPAHVHPTKQWSVYNDSLKNSAPISVLENKEMYNPEIVYCMDDLSTHVDIAKFEMIISDHHKLTTEFNTAEFNSATRWILFNGDQSVGANVLPATCRPEGFISATEKGTVIYLEPNEVRTFKVTKAIVKI